MATTQRNTLIMGKMELTGWTAKKKAKDVERKAESDNGAKAGTISARKSLLPGAEALDNVSKYMAGCRSWWTTVSKDWIGTARVYHAAKHFDIQTEMGDRQREFYRLVDLFMQEYPVLRAEAQFQLNNLFDPADYPDPTVVRAKFKFDFEPLPLPNGEDFRLIDGDLIPQEEVDRLVFEAEGRAASKMAEAMKSTYEELEAVIAHYINRLQAKNESEDRDDKKQASIHASVIGNILEIVDNMPGLNLTGDERLKNLTEQAKELAEMFTVDELKESRGSRILATQKAEQIRKQFAGLFN